MSLNELRGWPAKTKSWFNLETFDNVATAGVRTPRESIPFYRLSHSAKTDVDLSHSAKIDLAHFVREPAKEQLVAWRAQKIFRHVPIIQLWLIKVQRLYLSVVVCGKQTLRNSWITKNISVTFSEPQNPKIVVSKLNKARQLVFY